MERRLDGGFFRLRPVIGVIHLGPLPGSARSPGAGDVDVVRARALADAEALAQGGCHALLMENFGDSPFYPGAVPALTTACMARLAGEVKGRWPALPLGINVLRNDGLGALAVAVAAGADFVRVNVLAGARVTDQGVIQGIAHDLVRARAHWRATNVAIFADVAVKHSAPLGSRVLHEEVDELLKRSGADAVIVSGTMTGKAVDLTELQGVKSAAGSSPVVIGSGVTAEGLKDLMPWANGFIVGTALKKDGAVTNPVDVGRVRELMARHARLAGH